MQLIQIIQEGWEYRGWLVRPDGTIINVGEDHSSYIMKVTAAGKFERVFGIPEPDWSITVPPDVTSDLTDVHGWVRINCIGGTAHASLANSNTSLRLLSLAVRKLKLTGRAFNLGVSTPDEYVTYMVPRGVLGWCDSWADLSQYLQPHRDA